MNSLPTRIDRYPAKMVSRLATELIELYAAGAENILDPFCGSGAILVAGQEMGIPVTGVDINPYAILLSSVKLEAFDACESIELGKILISRAKSAAEGLPIKWDAKRYWFTPKTLLKYEKLRRVSCDLRLAETSAGRAVLLALALSVRLCSRADQRSPKPFISKTAIAQHGGRHLDPFMKIDLLIRELAAIHGKAKGATANLFEMDVADAGRAHERLGLYSHVITSPPYINAQDYFRNFKLELYILENLIPFSVEAIKNRFVGTERGLSRDLLIGEGARNRERLLPALGKLSKRKPKLACVVHKYISDMEDSLRAIRGCLTNGGVLVLVCGDNLVGGMRLRTWSALNKIIEELGFHLFDSFGDKIQCRTLPPARLGHKGLIKEEMISAFRLNA